MNGCDICPRGCGVDRTKKVGFCGVGADFIVARASLHPWEEPPIAGKNGSGTVFFGGCNLRCVYCQNREISRGGVGKPMTADELAAVCLDLQEQGAENLNFVTPTHYAAALGKVLQKIRPLLKIPVVYNCGGYEKIGTLRGLDGLVDVYLPDCKYYDGELSGRLSGAPDYFEVFIGALGEMLRQVGKPAYGADGKMTRGVIVRHLVLPGYRHDSIRILDELAERFGTGAFLLSLMRQYTPAFAADADDENLHRKVTTFEYESVLDEARKHGFSGFCQTADAATAAYTPTFS